MITLSRTDRILLWCALLILVGLMLLAVVSVAIEP